MCCDARFEVCGLIEMIPLTVHSRTVRVTDAASGELTSTATALDDGSFCVHCKPGLYHFSVGNLLVLHSLFCCNCRQVREFQQAQFNG